MRKTNRAVIAVIAAFSMLLGMFGLSGCQQGTAVYENAERALFSNIVTGYSFLQEEVSELSAADNAQTGKATITVTPEQYLISLMEAGQINPTVLEIDAEMKGGDIFTGFIYKNGAKEVLSGDVWITGEQLILDIPALLDKYIFTDLGELEDLGSTVADMSDSDDALSGFLSGLIAGIGAGLSGDMDLPSEKMVKEIVDAVLDEYFELTKDIKVEKDIDIEINGNYVKTDKNTIEITDEIGYKLGIAALNAIKDNEELKTIVSDIAASVMPNIDSSLIDMTLAGAVVTMQDNLDAISKPEVVVSMDVYIDSSKNIVKRVISSADPQARGEVSIVSYSEKDDRYYDIAVSAGGESYQIAVVCNTKSGDYKLTIDGYENYKIEVNGTYKDGNFSATLILDAQKVVTVEIAISDKADIKDVPALDGSNSVDMGDEEQMGEVSLELLATLGELMENFADDSGNYDLIGVLIQQLGDSLGDLGDFDLEGLEDFNFEDFEDFDLEGLEDLLGEYLDEFDLEVEAAE